MESDAPSRTLPGVCVLCGKRLESEELDLLAVLARSGYPHQYACHPACLKTVAVPNFAGVGDLELSREEFDARRQSVAQRFTPRARRALASTSQLAHGYGHAHVGVEHLLLALASEEEGAAASVLNELGVRAEIVERLDVLLRSAAYNEPLGATAEEGSDDADASE